MGHNQPTMDNDQAQIHKNIPLTIFWRYPFINIARKHASIHCSSVLSHSHSLTRMKEQRKLHNINTIMVNKSVTHDTTICQMLWSSVHVTLFKSLRSVQISILEPKNYLTLRVK